MTDHDRPLLPSKAQLHVRWGQLYGSATSLWLAEAARKASGPLLVIAANARQASRMEDELRFFCEPGTYIEHFPAWETLPYDLFSPHPDIVSQRLRMLSTLPRLAKGIVVVDLETALQRLPPQLYIEIQKGREVHLCPSCNRILFHRPEQSNEASSTDV